MSIHSGKNECGREQSRFVTNRKSLGIGLRNIKDMEPTTNEKTLIKNVKDAWSHIPPEILELLISGMPKRIFKCLQLKGGYTGQ